MDEEYIAKIEVFGWRNTELSTTHPEYFCISGDGKGDQGAILRPKLTGAIDAPVKSLWLPGAFGQVFVDFRWQRRDMVFTVFLFGPNEDTTSEYHTVDSLWRQSWDYVHETTIRYTYQDETMLVPDVREIRVRLLEEPKAYNADSWEGKDPHLFNGGNVVMTVAAELPFYTGPTQVYEWEAEPGDFEAEVDFSPLADGPVPASFTKAAEDGLGGVSVIGGALKWTSSGSAGAFETYIYNAGEPETDAFEVAVTLGNDGELGLFPGALYLIGRADASLNNYCFCLIRENWVRFGAVVSGVPVFFSLLPFYFSAIAPGARVAFAGTGDRRFRLKINDEVVATDYDDLNVAHSGVGYRKVGIRFEATATWLFGQHEPPEVVGFDTRDVPSSDSSSHTFIVSVPCDVPVWPRWILTDKADWTLPDYSFGNEEYGRPIADAARTVTLPHLPDGAGVVADSDPRRQTLLAADRSHVQGRWKGQDLLYPIPNVENAHLEVTVNNAEDGYAARLEIPTWYTRPWGRPIVLED